jgi:YD repeat-containing protein
MKTLLRALVCSTPLALLGCAPLDNANADTAVDDPRWLPVQRERDGIVETWEYDDEVRLLAIDERVPCRCLEKPRQLSRFSYSDRSAQRATDRDADGVDDELQVVQRDELGRVTRFERELVDGDDQSLTFAWDEAGRVVNETDERGTQRTAVRDAFGRITTLLENGVAFVRYTYDDAGRPTSAASGDTTTTYAYDDDGRVVLLRTANASTFDISTTYQYDDDGQLVSVRAANTEQIDTALTTDDYRYDLAGRLISHVSVDHRSEVTTTMETAYDDLGRPVLSTTRSGDVQWTTSTSYRELGDDEVEVTTTDELDSRVTRFRRFATPLRDDLALPSLYVEFPSTAPRFIVSFPEPL